MITVSGLNENMTGEKDLEGPVEVRMSGVFVLVILKSGVSVLDIF